MSYLVIQNKQIIEKKYFFAKKANFYKQEAVEQTYFHQKGSYELKHIWKKIGLKGLVTKYLVYMCNEKANREKDV